MDKEPKDINTRTSIYVLKDPRNQDIRYCGNKVICIFVDNDTKTFENASLAASYFNCSLSTIYGLCNNKLSSGLIKIKWGIKSLQYEE